jgi:alpha-1,6-mannosyltransferase
VSQLCFHAFSRKVAGLYGNTAANFFLLFTATQFHIPFYLSRTLPNFLVLPVVVLGLAQLLATDIPTMNAKSPARRLQLGVALLVSAGIIGRSEVAVLCGTIISIDLFLSPSPKRYIQTILPAIIVSGIVSAAATVAVDTHLWNSPSFPELEGLMFNIIGGHASEWGIQPWNYYLLSFPKLLLNPLSIPLILSTIVITRYTSLSILDTIRKLRYILMAPIVYILGFSYLPHKEWRFIIYIIPLLTTATSISAAYIHHHRSKSLLYRLTHLLLILSIPTSLIASLTMSIISATNYPGALALDSLHAMSNISQARVYLDIPSRMTGATLPLCCRRGWTYTKSENATVLESTEYWKDIDFALIGSLADIPCRHGRGIEGKGEWEVVYRQKGYSGMQWQPFAFPEMVRNNTLVAKVMSHERVKNVLGKIEGFVERRGGFKVPWIKLEDQVFVLRHLRKEDLAERSILLEEKIAKERAGIGHMGEVEGQWRDFY